jgi:hypothetical protein
LLLDIRVNQLIYAINASESGRRDKKSLKLIKHLSQRGKNWRIMRRKGKKIATKNICVKASNVYQKPTIINLKGWITMIT